MAIAFRSTNGVTSGTSTGTDIVVTKPSAVADGDLLVVGIYHDDATVSTVPSGWAEVASIKNTTASPNFYIRMYWKRASSEGSSWTWVIGTSGWFAWECAAYTGGLASGDALTGTPTTYQADSTDCVLPTLTTGVDGAMLVGVAGNFPGSTWSGSSAPLTNERADGNGLTLYDGIQASAGASGAKTLSIPSADKLAGVMCALAPYVAPAGLTLTAEQVGSVIHLAWS